MTVKELYAALDAQIPATLSEEWDNDGLMCCPDGEKEVGRILFALDVTDNVVAYAKKTRADVIISHHPLIFAPITALTEETPVASRLLRLVKAKISVFSFHTRFDRVSGGVNDVLAKTLRLSNVAPLGEGEASLGRIGTLPQEMSLSDFAEYAKRALGAPMAQAWDASRPVSRVAVVGGEGRDFIEAATCAGADTYLSGRLGYHAMQDGKINLVELGHYFTERPSLSALCDLVQQILPEAQTEIYTPNPMSTY